MVAVVIVAVFVAAVHVVAVVCVSVVVEAHVAGPVRVRCAIVCLSLSGFAQGT